MKKNTVFIVLLLALSFTSCMTEKHNFPVEKEYWDVNDYDKAILDLRFTYEDNETKPTLDHPEQRIIVEKLTNPQNFKIILDDNKLDFNQRNKIASEFISHWKDMNQIYNVTESGKYVYGKEMLAVWQFGLELQLAAFDLQFDEILAKSDNPEDEKVKKRVNASMKKLIDNYGNYLNLITNEDAFYEKEKEEYAKGIDTYFKQLIQVYPDADYDRLLNKANAMLKKTRSATIKKSLKRLIDQINTLNNKDEA
ncbi:hypothetical protein [Tenacibaculum amylolyticum]|uniref:hypothetical protein n=1 Tax=Tenacibaculum amylolyticum TaxID=104269 RepID=UPI003894A56F